MEQQTRMNWKEGITGYKSSCALSIRALGIRGFRLLKICSCRRGCGCWDCWLAVWSARNITIQEPPTRTICLSRRRSTISFITSPNQLKSTIHGTRRVKNGTSRRTSICTPMRLVNYDYKREIIQMILLIIIKFQRFAVRFVY